MPNANNGGSTNFRLHPDKHIKFWSEGLIEIVVPSIGYASNTQYGLDACAGSGMLELHKAESEGGGYAEVPLVIPYAVNNFAENATFPELYTPHEVRLHNANSHGGYTFVYDASFYNNAPALAAFRRALKTWRCATGIHFKDICSENVFCETDEASTRVLVSFAKDCFDTSTPTVLASTQVVPQLNPGCPEYFTDRITLAFRPPSELIYNCGPGTTTCPAVWNYDNAGNATPNAYNFEKVATHELGHVLLLQHVIDASSLMHYNTQVGNEIGANIKEPDTNTLQGIEYILGRDVVSTSNCSVLPLVLLNADDRCKDLPGSGKTDVVQDETACFVDLYMRDNHWDIGKEPNVDAIMPSFDGIYGTADDWEAIWESPDLWS